jgi:hypothetical protein
MGMGDYGKDMGYDMGMGLGDYGMGGNGMGMGDVTVCATASDFDPEAVMYGMCDFQQMPDGALCSAAGCFSYPGYPDGEYCHCEEQRPCVELGGTFLAHTCAMEAPFFSEGHSQASPGARLMRWGVT